MADVITHLAARKSPEGYPRGMFCAKASFWYAGTGHHSHTLDRRQVTCKRCLAKMAKHPHFLNKEEERSTT